MAAVSKRLLALCLLLWATAVGAHPSPQSEVLLESRQDSIHAELVLPLDELKLAIPLDGVSDAALAQYLAAHVRPLAPDGRAWLVKVERLRWQRTQQPFDLLADMTLRPPPGAPLDRFSFGDDAIAHQVPSHLTVVALRSGPDAPSRVLGTLHYGQRSLEVQCADPRWWAGFADLFQLGMQHIAEGTDHLLFLLTLLLPAALLAQDGKWQGYGGTRHLLAYLLKVVTAFTLGHSVTLMLGALGTLSLPEQPVEFAIALSILFSAVHAWRPIFPRREAWVAFGFGLVHGLAFASAIRALQLSGARLVAGVLAFNLGIEVMQALVIALAAPLLIWLARRPSYRRVRQAAALLAAAMAVIWMAQRV
ncbi:HupE/UreJ family protein [Duganella sp. FT135W]|uniref:HupE/UreJ family protein n=1 Tax=Duganella flavida TaxID=2692175 RepID=A0A6L8K4T1_9BURK|nr:HupE/UreJ family protein [Duganella flavida]MYM21178.1 HupE/UreJ family protein [Duganella flavida]